MPSPATAAASTTDSDESGPSATVATSPGAIIADVSEEQPTVLPPSSDQDRDQPASLPGPDLMGDMSEQCVAAYFTEFHPEYPILHRPTFALATAPEPLAGIVVAIGCLYHDRTEASRQKSRQLWERSVAGLEGTALSDPGHWEQTWILQTSLLCVVFGAFAADQFGQSRLLLSRLVRDIREVGLLHQSIYGYYHALWRQRLDVGMIMDTASLAEAWQSYVEEEALKMGLYAVCLLDFQLVLACNTRPEMSPLELLWDLPWSARAWDAPTAQLWWLHIVSEAAGYHQPPMPGSGLPATGPVSDRGPAAQSLSTATQALLLGGSPGGSPEPSLLQALRLSPFALFCITANIHRLVRGFTHCAYQLPPAPSNPSPFHILTHSQNSQLSIAVKIILGIAEGAGVDGDASAGLWRATRLFCAIVKISLCIPDEFLICGIVDNSISAAFATAAHLSLGNEVLGRRSRGTFVLGSLPSVPHTFGDEGFLLVLRELVDAMHLLWGQHADDVCREPPWVSVAGFRVLLDLYRVLRLATTDLHDNPPAAMVPASFSPAQAIHTTLAEALTMYVRRKRSCLSTASLSQLGLLEVTDDARLCERKFLLLMAQSCYERNVWSVGRNMASVLEDISSRERA